MVEASSDYNASTNFSMPRKRRNCARNLADFVLIRTEYASPGPRTPLVPCAKSLGAPSQRLYGRSATNPNADVQQRIQQIKKHGVNHLLRNRLFPRQPERGRQFLGDLQPDRIRQHIPRPVFQIRHRNRRLQDSPAMPVHVKLAARKPPEISGIGGIEQH